MEEEQEAAEERPQEKGRRLQASVLDIVGDGTTFLGGEAWSRLTDLTRDGILGASSRGGGCVGSRC